jgi:hypothetical protein
MAAQRRNLPQIYCSHVAAEMQVRGRESNSWSCRVDRISRLAGLHRRSAQADRAVRVWALAVCRHAKLLPRVSRDALYSVRGFGSAKTVHRRTSSELTSPRPLPLRGSHACCDAGAEHRPLASSRHPRNMARHSGAARYACAAAEGSARVSGNVLLPCQPCWLRFHSGVITGSLQSLILELRRRASPLL